MARARQERLPLIAEQTLDYVLRELRLDGGGFASAQDADTDGVEGLTFTWEPHEVPREELLQPFEHGRYIIRGRLDAEERRRCSPRASSARSRSATTRRSPSWNGLCSRRSQRRGGGSTARTTSTRRARSPSSCSARSPTATRLHRTWRDGVAKGTGYLEDYANVAHGLYELHVATGDLRWLHESRRLALLAVELFADDANGGFFLTPVDGEALVARQKDLDDNPTPAGNSMLAFVLLRLARLWGDDELERRAVGVLRLVRDAIPRAPQAFGWALCALDLHLSPPREVAIVGDRASPVARAALARLGPEHGRRVRARATACRCSRARISSAASRPSTSASASPAKRL